jgi:purine catabolism regulator
MPATESGLTVEALWDLALPAGTTLLGGEAGLSRRVEWAAALRASYPIFGEIAEGYLALARLEVAHSLDPHLTPGVLIHELAGAQAAALVVDEPLAAADIALADAAGLPVLLVPTGADVRRLERDILRTLVDREGQIARREVEARRALQQVHDQRGLQGVAEELAQLVLGRVTVADTQGRMIASATSIKGEEAGKPNLPSDRTGAPAEERSEYAIRAGGRDLGRLVVTTPPGRRRALDALYARQAAEVCAVEMIQQCARQETEERLGADLVEQLMDGQTDAETLLARLARLGYPLVGERRQVVLALAATSATAGACETTARDLRFALQTHFSQMLQVRYRDHVLLVCALEPRVPERRLRSWLAHAAAATHPLGVSRPATGLEGLREAVRQALDAASLGARLHDHTGPCYYDDLGLYRLLAGLRNRAEVERFYEETLGALVRYDREHGGELAHTLAVFFAENANASQAAKSLHVHRNTLSYRLQRIAEITGLDLDDPEARLALQVALAIHRLQAPPS